MPGYNDIINQIQGALGAQGARDLAEQIYGELRTGDLIVFSGGAGNGSRDMAIREGVDLAAVGAQVLEQNRVHENWQRSAYIP